MIRRGDARPSSPRLCLLPLLGLLLLAPPGLSATQTPTAPATALADAGAGTRPGSESTVRLRLRPLPVGVRRVWLETDADGRRVYVMDLLEGGQERLSPDAFAARLAADTRDRTLLFRVFNITSVAGIAWVALGLAGQVLFAGRMVVQWVSSERSRRSVVPTAFWWMSLGGASILLTYFIWRRDIVGVLGQGMGWLIYGRNLWLIHRSRPVPERLEVRALGR